MTTPSDDPIQELDAYLRRNVGADIRREDLDTRREADLIRRESLSLSDILLTHSSRGDRLRLVLNIDDYTLEGFVLHTTPRLVSLTLFPSGIRVDLDPQRIAMIEEVGEGRGHQPPLEAPVATTFRGRLRDLQRSHTPVEITLAGGRRKGGVLAAVAEDHLQLDQQPPNTPIDTSSATTIRLAHILDVRTHLKNRPRWEHQ